MANELIVGVKIGAALAGTFQAAFASARGTLGQLGQTVDLLKVRHDRLGRAMAQSLTHPMRNVGALREQYERLGVTIERVTARQAALAASIARGDALRQQRGDLRGQVMETVGTGVALGAPVVQSVRLAAGHEDRMRDIAITGDFSAAEEASVGASVRAAAVRFNQYHEDVAAGVGKLVAGGIQSAKELSAYAPLMAKFATATRASMEDLGSVAIALRDNLGISSAGLDNAMNMLAYAGKRGQFEIRDMAKWVPSLAPSFQALGVTGKEAVAEIGAALQVARMGAGTNDEAANNFRNFLQKLTAPDTIKDFAKAGIDLKKSMLTLRAQGLTPVQAMLGTITAYMSTKGPKAAAELEKTLKIKDDKERHAALQRLSEAYALGDLFQDMQVMAFIRPALANSKEMASIKSGAVEAGNQGVIDKDYERRVQTSVEQFKAFRIGLRDVGITIGAALLPALNDLLQSVMPAVRAFGDWAKTHPTIIKGVVSLVGGLLLGKLAVLGVVYAVNLLLTPFVAVRTAITAVSARWTILRALWQTGRFAGLTSSLASVSAALLTAGRFALLFGRGVAMTFIGPVALMSRAALWLGGLLAGRLVTGLRLAAQAVVWLGRALLLNPIGLAVTAVGVAAYLVWRHWGTIKGAFVAAWGWLRGLGGRFMAAGAAAVRAVAGGVQSGLAAVRGTLSALANQFVSAGRDLVHGLVAGLTSRLSAAREAIVSLGSSIKSWFKAALGINSPSRVFAEYGDNIVQGAAVGIKRTAPLAASAVAGMAMSASAAAAHVPPVALPLRAPTAAAAFPAQERARQVLASHAAAKQSQQPAAGPAGAATGGVVIHFAPTIHVPGGPAARAAVTEALQVSLPELERLIQRVTAQQQRRSN
ncbi:phage tail tape measure protein [Acidovorax sp. GBBC 3332]|nr:MULTISPECIES: phage tail tape measure protein [unclassified Acidovorax]MDA8449841.1 phage tail tape measure protein [Acidovorax sp. GBBC 3297]MDA8459286.1 phage tail tape measure protein [Acidovorax sp. GBBC 3333]MDA8464323.1 phage tail tape measure protein [Acidovorax sp. GBBC 3332]MDA8469466.1 phage tail tape measure protein [Acidovorax sp. GBBC 3299]